MPKVSVYLPDELYKSARQGDLPISALTQEAIRAELRRRDNAEWVQRARRRPSRPAIDTAALIDAVREDFGS